MVSYIIKSTAHRQERRFNSHASTHKGVLCANGAVHPKISKPRNGIVLTFVYFCNETKISCNNPCADYRTMRVVVPIHLNNGTNPSQINFAVPEMEPFFLRNEQSRGTHGQAVRHQRKHQTTRAKSRVLT